MRLKNFLKNWILAFVYPKPFIGVAYLPRFFSHWYQYSRKSQAERVKLIDIQPCLGDWTSTTPFDPHYFYQAGWVARKLATVKPDKHMDIGSDIRIMNVLSAFIPTEFLDYRPLNASLPGLRCQASDLLALTQADNSIMSLSCLHVIEHIGLGRYGDPLDPEGSIKAAKELTRILAPGGMLYVSTPVGQQRVCFNAHRVFSPATVVDLFSDLNLVSFSYVDDTGKYYSETELHKAEKQRYACGMYVFKK